MTSTGETVQLFDFLRHQTQSAQLLMDLLDRATSGVYLWNADADQVQWSPRLFETLGYTADEMSTYAGIEALTHPDDQAAMGAAVADSRETGEVYQIQLRIRRSSGQYGIFDVHGVWEKGADGQELLLGFLTDVTDVETARQEARRAEALFLAFFQNAPAAVYIKTKDQRHVYSNETAAELMGVSLEDLLSKPSDEVFSKEAAEKYAEADKQVFETGETLVWTGDVETGTGDRLHILDTKFPVENPETGETMLGGVAIDITRQHNAERALAQSQKLEAVGQLVSGVAHDFNNTLAVILGSLELLESPQDAEEADALRRDALSAVERGARLTRQLLAFAHNSALDTATVNLNDLVQSMDGMLRRIIPESIQIETVTGGGLWNTEIDAAQAESALLNLALNARDSMPNGGRLTIETSNMRIGPEYIEERQEELKPGRYVLLAVSDTGVGMSEEEVARAFEPFYTTKPVGKGTGMGLSMVYGLMRQFNGAARIYSEEGIGTTVKLIFPASNGDSVSLKSELRATIRDGTERVLLVEDDEKLRGVLERQVRSLGYRVTVADSGDAALDLLQGGLEVDLLVTDVVMPGSLMGTQLAQRARGLMPTLPVIFLSGYPAEASIHGNGLHPEDIVLMKPVSLESLSKQMRRALDGGDNGG
ncbi:MAG: PAS domain S-box protein [Woeseiaceae bacterium]|nr:PAS domain S-box protein [Woeseiaceae bacterium]